MAVSYTHLDVYKRQEGCVLAKKDGEFAAIIALKCETDFVAKNADFIALTQAILDAAVATPSWRLFQKCGG